MCKRFCSLLLIIVALALSFAFVQTAVAALLTWKLNGVTFGKDGSGSVMGWFKYDTTSKVCPRWELTVTFPPPGLEGYYYFGNKYTLTDSNSTCDVATLTFISTLTSPVSGLGGHLFLTLNIPAGSGFPASLSPGPFDVSGIANNVLVMPGPPTAYLQWGYDIPNPPPLPPPVGWYSGYYPPVVPVLPLLESE